MRRIVFIVSFCLVSYCQAAEILDISEGLTLAQVIEDGTVHVLAVTADNGENIQAVDISKYSGIYGAVPSVFQQLGYTKIQDIVATQKNHALATYSYDSLMSPAGTDMHHIALGLNYNEHAEEVDAEHMPFLFLKNTQPTRQQQISTGAQKLLDYEVEVCVRPLNEIYPNTDIGNVDFGFFVCGDFSDRAVLLRNMNLKYMQSGEGFSMAKSGIGYLPTGPYLVVPKNRELFMERVEIKLYRNGELKQHGSPAEMVWPLETVIRKIFLAEQAGLPTFSGISAHWLPDGAITPEMVFLTGTPEGVIMQSPTIVYKIISGIQFIVTGAFLDMTVSEFTVKKYISGLLDDRIFLQPGERVTMQGSFMGSVEVIIDQE